MQLSDIIYEKGNHFVVRGRHGYEVYRQGITHATKCATIGYARGDDFQRAVTEVNRREADSTPSTPPTTAKE